MKCITRVIVVCALSATLAGCRQADGPVPTPATPTEQNEVNDLHRNLQNVAGRDRNGPKELTEDLARLAGEAGQASATELGRRLGEVLAGVALNEQTSQRLAHDLWVTVTGRELSARQVESLQKNLQSLLTSAGIAEASATPVAEQVGEVQRTVTTRPKRWYEVF